MWGGANPVQCRTGGGMTSVIPTLGKPIKYKNVTIGDITTNSTGSATVTSYKPSGMNNFLFAGISYWNYTTPASAISISCLGDWITANPNTTIKGLIVRYYYTD